MLSTTHCYKGPSIVVDNLGHFHSIPHSSILFTDLFICKLCTLLYTIIVGYGHLYTWLVVMQSLPLASLPAVHDTLTLWLWFCCCHHRRPASCPGGCGQRTVQLSYSQTYTLRGKSHTNRLLSQKGKLSEHILCQAQ